ncbi:MAG: hypothetical protein GEU74_10545 [Nitriliruptorales bacterium]|nr:hypothetical protein [Nitriliruptorales bacterium]
MSISTNVSTRAGEPGLDSASLRRVLGHFASGVVVVTAIDVQGPVGMTAQSFCSLSLEPPLVLFCPAKSSRSWPRIAAAQSFAVNVLDTSHATLCRQFAVSGGDKFAGVSWMPSSMGAPLLDDAISWIECRTHAVHDGGDHHIVLGSVLSATLREGEVAEAMPLVFYRGGFGTFAPHEL